MNQVPEALDKIVRERIQKDHDEERKSLIELLGEEKYRDLISMVIKDAAPEACRLEYRTTDHFQMTATSLRHVGDFLRHMLAEGFPPETELCEPVTFYIDYTKDVRTP